MAKKAKAVEAAPIAVTRMTIPVEKCSVIPCRGRITGFAVRQSMPGSANLVVSGRVHLAFEIESAITAAQATGIVPLALPIEVEENEQFAIRHFVDGAPIAGLVEFEPLA